MLPRFINSLRPEEAPVSVSLIKSVNVLELHQSWGVEPKSLHQHLHKLGPRQASAFTKQHNWTPNQRK